MMKQIVAGTAARSAGLSLIELMVAVTIGAFMLLGLVTFASNSSRDQAEITKTARQIDNAQFGVQFIKDDIQNAGFYGHWNLNPSSLGALPDPCELDPAVIFAAASTTHLNNPVQAYNATRVGVNCVNVANYVAGTDIVVIRRAGSNVAYEYAGEVFDDITYDLIEDRIYIQSNIQGPQLDIAKGDAGDDFDLFERIELTQRKIKETAASVDLTHDARAPIRTMEIHIYFIAPCSNRGDCSLAGANQIPALKRLVLDHNCRNGEVGFNAAGVRDCDTADTEAGPIWVVEPIAEGIENMQLDYGIDTDEDGIANSNPFIAAPTAGDMANIVGVDVFLLARNNQETMGQQALATANPKSFVMGQAGTYTQGDAASPTPQIPIDGLRRNLYVTNIQVKNTAARRGTD